MDARITITFPDFEPTDGNYTIEVNSLGEDEARELRRRLREGSFSVEAKKTQLRTIEEEWPIT